jgi:hypothetical protein
MPPPGDGLPLDAAIVRNLAVLRGRPRRGFKRQRNSRPKARVRAVVIVTRNPFKERSFQVVLGKRNQEVRELLPARTLQRIRNMSLASARARVRSTRTPMASRAWCSS